MYETLEPEAYDNYRFELLSISSGVEHYVVKQLAWLRRLPMSELVWNEIRDLMSLQKSIQLGGPSVRKRAINYLMGRRRYEFWFRMGRIAPGERQEESELPDEWAAIHYGWGHSTDGEQPMGGGEDDEDSWSDDHGEAEEPEEEIAEAPPPVVTEESTGASSAHPAPTNPTPTTTGAGGKGKDGGKGRIPPETKDPPVEDEANV
eukprot:s850_g6.t1